MLLSTAPVWVPAVAWDTILPSALVHIIPGVLGKVWDFATLGYEKLSTYLEVKTYGGFREPQEIMERLERIAKNESEIRIYGQEKAKRQLVEVLSSVVARINSDKLVKGNVKEIRGNVIYIIGKSGTGKTKLCYAIADAFLECSDKACTFCHSEGITGESELGTQLFKTIATKDIGKFRSKNIFTGHDGLVAKDEESPLLKHFLKWHESVAIIDEYDKMKQKSAKPGTYVNVNGINIPTPGAVGAAVDNSADEIIRAIVSTGKYKFMNKEVDCSARLILVTTNETREELERNFGIGGVKGGGEQRLNIIEFEELTLDACQGIVNDLVEDVTNVLTNPKGIFKLKSVAFDKESLDAMARYIFEDKVMQGRAKNKLEDKIYSVFSKNIGKESGQEASLKFIPRDGDSQEHFARV